MQVCKWGNSLAVRLPADLVARLGVAEGDEIELVAMPGLLAQAPSVADNHGFSEGPQPALEPAREFEGPIGTLARSAKIGRWGGSLAVRIPAGAVSELKLKEDDEVEIKKTAKSGGLGPAVTITRVPDRLEVLHKLRRFRGLVPAGYKFKRADAYDES